MLAAAAGGLAAALLAVPSASADHGAKPTIVLVHGGFADASGWKTVIDQLQRDGYKTIAPANPLRGIPTDVAYFTRGSGIHGTPAGTATERPGRRCRCGFRGHPFA